MISTSLAALALSASMSLSLFPGPIHLHPRGPITDHRVTVTLLNKATSFRDVQIDGHTYSVQPQHVLDVKAPAGTIIFAASLSPDYHRGDAMFAVTPQMNKTRVAIR